MSSEFAWNMTPQGWRGRLITAFYDEIMDQRAPGEARHGSKVSRFAESLGRMLQVPEDEIAMLSLAARLHDVGKVTLPESIINKPGELSKPQRFLVRQHPYIGTRILAQFELGRIIEDVILHHHERYDGLGYPDKLKREQISLHANIVHIADVYEALTNQRPYRPAPYSRPEAMQMILADQGGYHPEVLEAFKVLARQMQYEP